LASGTKQGRSEATEYKTIKEMGTVDMVFQPSAEGSWQELLVEQEISVSSVLRREAPRRLVFSMIVLMVLFCIGTPLTMLLTVPAYALADKVKFCS